jgi:ABC-type transporter Mla subunit MlaD
MQYPWTIVGVVLLGVLVGAATPVLFQLYSTLRATRKLLERLGPKMNDALDELHQAGQRFSGLAGALEQNTKRAQALFDAVGDIGESVSRLRDSLKTASAVGAALGPAIAAAIGALQSGNKNVHDGGDSVDQDEGSSVKPDGDGA